MRYDTEFWIAHREAEARGLGTLLIVGDQVDWLPTRQTPLPADLGAAATLWREVEAHVRSLVSRARAEGVSWARLSELTGLPSSTLRRWGTV